MTLLFPIAAVLCLFPMISSAVALFLGIIIAVGPGNPFIEKTRKLTPLLLQISVVGLGAGMDLRVVGKVGAEGIGYTVIGIAFAMILGNLLGRLLKTTADTSLLISVGTAICGGSAIAALAPTIRAKHHEVSVALGTVFMLNAVALVIFPWIGHYYSLSESQFGLWSALAIHDTSSVVGANLLYGPHALAIGTTVKLARALWIVPVTFGIGLWRARNQTTTGEKVKAKRPWFILGFVLVAALVTWVPSLQVTGHYVEWAARRALVLTLFLIGASLSREVIRSVGVRPFVQGILLWVIVASTTLGAVVTGLIHI